MEVFNHHIYEYKKGLRRFVLFTCACDLRPLVVKKLEKEKIDYVIHNIDERRINVFFGEKECVEVLKSFSSEKLNHLSDEEDFILGTMLGYDRILQCRRYLERKKTNQKAAS